MIVRCDAPAGVQAAMIIHAAGQPAQLRDARSADPPTTAVALEAPAGIPPMPRSVLRPHLARLRLVRGKDPDAHG